MTAPAVERLDVARARRLTRRIRENLQAAAADLITAWQGRAWEALGFASWEAYLDASFGDLVHIRLPVTERRERVAAMRAAGMSQRAIAPALGVSAGTVASDFTSLGPVGEGAVVISLNGSRRAAAQTPARRRREPKTDRTVQILAAAGPAGLTVRQVARALRCEQHKAAATLTRLTDAGRIAYRRPQRRGLFGTYAVANA